MRVVIKYILILYNLNLNYKQNKIDKITQFIYNL